MMSRGREILITMYLMEVIHGPGAKYNKKSNSPTTLEVNKYRYVLRYYKPRRASQSAMLENTKLPSTGHRAGERERPRGTGVRLAPADKIHVKYGSRIFV